jgi:subfamily B ATP-binding cassette protein HlyB/CyaB
MTQSTDILDLLRSTLLFSTFFPDDVHSVAEDFQKVNFAMGQTVFRPGEPAENFYLVMDGKVRIMAPGPGGKDVSVALLERADYFGEQALLTETNHSFTARAAGRLTLLCLPKSAFLRLVSKNPALDAYLRKYMADFSVRNFLRTFSGFAALQPGAIQALARHLEPESYADGQHIFEVGEAAASLYIVRSGSVRLASAIPDDDTVVTEGGSFGELALLENRNHEENAIAVGDVELFALPKTHFLDLLGSTPDMRARYMRKLQRSRGLPVPATAAEAAVRVSTRLPLPTGLRAPTVTATVEPVYEHAIFRKYPFVRQHDETDCGAACLSMICAAYGKRVGVAGLRDLANVGPEGASMASLAEAAEQLGFRSRAVKGTWPALASTALPAIVHWMGIHFVVLYNVSSSAVVVGDPAIGIRKLSKAEFMEGWTGRMLLFTATPDVVKLTETAVGWSRFLPLIWPHSWLLLEILVCSLLLNLFGLVSPLFSQVIIDQVLVYRSASLLNVMLVGVLIVSVFQTLTGLLRQYLSLHVATKIDSQLIAEFYRHLLSLPMKFFGARKVGDSISRFEENTRIRAFLTEKLTGVVLDTIMATVYVCTMFYYNVYLALLALLPIPALFSLTWVFTPRIKQLNREGVIQNAEAQSLLTESVMGIGTIKSLAVELPVRWRWEAAYVKSVKTGLTARHLAMSLGAVTNFVSAGSSAALLWYGAHLVMGGQLTVGQLMAFSALVGNVLGPVGRLLGTWDDLQQASISVERLTDVLECKPEQEGSPGELLQTASRRIAGTIEFQNVSFWYGTRDQRAAVSNVKFTAVAGQLVAIVGRSGAGKSTLGSLLQGLYRPSEGRILVDGADLAGVPLQRYRRQVGAVLQDNFLFSGTIRDNIALGELEPSMERVLQAAHMAGVDEFVSQMPLGYSTIIGERGISLSGGQRQRVAIARALFRDPRILIFDEATSALDSESEANIQANLGKVLQGRTAFVIAHRLSTVRDASLILVMDGGTIVERGTHAELLERRGLYYHLVYQQIKE